MNAQEIKKLRKEMALNQTDFANLIGSSRKSVSDWETGRRRPLKIAIIAMSRLSASPRHFGEPDPVYDAG